MRNIFVLLPYILLAIWFVYSITYLYRFKKDPDGINPYIFESIPQIFPTIGILGTFIGIAYGLWYFDVNNIEGSIPELLNGLKTAFLASIGGIILLIIFSNRTAVIQKRNEAGKLSSETIALNTLIELITELKNDQQQAVVPELRALRAEVGNLGKKLQDMNTEMSQAIIKELANALNNMIEEFKMSMSFAKFELEKLTAQLGEAGNSIAEVTPMLQSVTERLNESLNAIQDLVKQLSPSSGISEKMQKQIEEMNEILHIFIQTRNISLQNFAMIETKLNTFLSQIQNGICKFPRL